MGRQEYELWTNKAPSTIGYLTWETINNWRSVTETKYVTLHDEYVHRFMKQDMPMLEAVGKAGKMLNEISARYEERQMTTIHLVPWVYQPTWHTTHDERRYHDHDCINLMTLDDPLAVDNTPAMTAQQAVGTVHSTDHGPTNREVYPTVVSTGHMERAHYKEVRGWVSPSSKTLVAHPEVVA